MPETRERHAAKLARVEPACCLTKALVTQRPPKGVGVQLKKACVLGCDKPCRAALR